MAKHIGIQGCVLFAVLLAAPVNQAQETDAAKNDTREQPVASYPAALPAGSTSLLTLNPPPGGAEDIQLAGYDRPLSGVQGPTLGPTLGAGNFLVPSFSATTQLATNSSASGFVRPTE